MAVWHLGNLVLFRWQGRKINTREIVAGELNLINGKRGKLVLGAERRGVAGGGVPPAFFNLIWEDSTSSCFFLGKKSFLGEGRRGLRNKRDRVG